MEKFCFDLTAIVVGNTRQSVIQQITSYLKQTNIAFEVCENIYSALGAMARAPAGTNLFVVGGFVPFTAETIRFFSLAPRDKRVCFCCVAKKFYESMQSNLLEAAKAGVVFINGAEKLEHIIKQFTSSDDTGAARMAIGKNRDFATRIASLADNFFLTQAEQNALLGDEHDASLAFTE